MGSFKMLLRAWYMYLRAFASMGAVRCGGQGRRVSRDECSNTKAAAAAASCAGLYDDLGE
jgi:hypothetical protein